MAGLYGIRIRLALAACALSAVCCGAEHHRLNLVIVAVDTLRADHLGCYGYERRTTPNIDNLASQGVLCERCVSQAPWTLPSFSTVFTSLYPAQHGANTVHSRLGTSFPTLAGILKDRGYATGAIINAPALKPAYGTDRGFDYYNMTPLNGRVADGTTRDALAWLDTVADKPFFAFVHYFDPHLPYTPPPAYARRFTGDYHGRIGDSFNLEGFSRVRDSMFVQMRDLLPADWHQIVSLHDAEIAFTDSAIADLIKGIDARGLRSSTLIVFLSDHGEEFFEHGGFEHGHTLYDEIVHVPLLFSLPGTLPSHTRLSRQVRLLDVAPTVLDFLGIEPPAHFEGVSIRPLLEGKGRAGNAQEALLPCDVAYSEALMHGREKKSVAAYPWKLVYEMSTEKEVLFNLEEDPGESHSVLGAYPDRADDLNNLLFRALFGTSDTWYVEMASGRAEETFDMDIVTRREFMPGDINVYRFMDRNGRLVDPPGALSVEGSGSGLRLKDFKLRGSLTLAFKIYPPAFPVTFDFSIDGRPALQNTHLGRNLTAPKTMPFSEKANRAEVTSAERPAPPQPPYALVWCQESRYHGETGIKLDEETKKELRALGYIQ